MGSLQKQCRAVTKALIPLPTLIPMLLRIPNEPEEAGAFLVEEQAAPEAETSCFEEPDSPRDF